MNRYFIAIAALQLARPRRARCAAATVQQAIEKYGIDPEKPNPVTV